MADWLTDLYQQKLGRAPDQAGYDYWSNLANSGTSQADIAAGIGGTSEGQAYASGANNPSIDSSAFTATSSSGLPSELQGPVTSQILQYLPSALSGAQSNTNSPFASTVNSVINQLQNNPYLGNMLNAFTSYAQNTPGQIEALRQAQGSQYLAGMKPLEQLYQPALDTMAKRGIVNSTITGDAIKNIQDQINQGYEQTVAGANTQAAQNLLNYQSNLPQLAATLAGTFGTQIAAPGNLAVSQEGANTSQQNLFANLISQLLNVSRQTQSNTPSSVLASYLFGGY